MLCGCLLGILGGRLLVQPAFSKARLEGYAAIMGEEIAGHVAGYGAGGERDVSADMMELTLRIVTRSLFGQTTSSSDVAVVRHAMHVLQNGLISLPLPIPDWASPTRRRMQKAMAGMNQIIDSMIETRRSEGIEGRTDLLSVLLGAVDDEGDGKGMSTEEIKAQLVTLFLAGHETTSNALTWSLYLLGDNPEVAEKLHVEVDEVLGGRAGITEAPSYADYARLPYTRQALKEAMRLFPPLYVMARMAAEDVRVGPWCIPKGSEVVLWTYHVQRDPSLFERPWEFRPERFSPEMEATIPKGAYFPFGAGPRACIGTQFALIEGTLALAALTASYRFSLPAGHDVQLAPRLTLSPKGGLSMMVEPRR